MQTRLARAALIVSAIAAFPFHVLTGQQPIYIAPNAPRDQPADLTSQCQWRALVKATESLVAGARRTYPAAKQRFIAGLPPRQTFFITVRIDDSLAHHEQVFIAVDSVAGDRIVGRIASEIGLVRGYRAGQRYVSHETDVVDWLISKPDGSEEGNAVGKFLDTYQPPRDCRDSGRTN